MAALYSIRAILAQHKQENPTSALSEKTIRQAVKAGDLPTIWAGNRALICNETFERWVKGEIQHG